MHIVEKSLAMPDELLAELNWAQSRPSVKTVRAAAGAKDLVLDLRDDDAFYLSLTMTEQEYLEEYRARWPGMAYSMNQDPTSGHGMHSSDYFLHTLIHNCGMLMCESIPETSANPHGMPKANVRRWMTGSEMLVAQGFPLHPSFPRRPLNGGILSSFEVSRPRKVRVLGAQAGNSMHTNCAGMLDVHFYTCVSEYRISPVFRRVAFLKRAYALACADDPEDDSPEQTT